MPNVPLTLPAGLAPSGITTMVARVYAGGALVATVALAEAPAGSGRYTGTWAGAAASTAYDWTAFDGSGNAYGEGSFTTDPAGGEPTPPAVPGPGPAPYLSTTDAAARAAAMFGVDAFVAASAADQAKALAKASDQVDRSMRYQGRKFLYNQPREFPRAAYDSARRSLVGIGPVGPTGFGVGDVVWDWDANNNVAVVPDAVLQAVIHQADALLRGDRQDRLDAQHDGVQDAMTGPLRETYDRKAPGSRTGLCRAAYELLQRYHLRSGRLM